MTEPLTLDALKEALSTYGVNPEERAMPVTVRVTDPNRPGWHETFLVATAIEVVYDAKQGQVLLQAVPDDGSIWDGSANPEAFGVGGNRFVEVQS